MPVDVNKIPDGLPGVVYAYHETVSVEEAQAALAQATALVNSLTDDTVYVIHDLTRLDVSFSHMMRILAVFTKDLPPAFADNDRFIAYQVGGSGLAKLVAQAASQVQYGSFNMHFAPTLDEALAEIGTDTTNGG